MYTLRWSSWTALFAVVLLAPACARELPLKPVERTRAASSAEAQSDLQPDAGSPSVRIDSPAPSPLLIPILPVAFHLTWTGVDPDAQSGQPAYYKHRLFDCTATEISCQVILADPDSLRRYYAPTFAGWDSSGAGTQEVLLTNLQPNLDYIFAITAFDDQGGYDHVFSLQKNVLRFRVSTAPFAGAPLLTVESDRFTDAQASPMYDPAPENDFPVDLPDTPLVIRWSARPNPYLRLVGYRWALDPTSLDASPARRTNGNRRDLQHWTEVSLANTSATIGPLRGAAAHEDHRLFIEAWSEFGYRSLVVLRLHPPGADIATRQLGLPAQRAQNSAHP